MSPRVTSTRSGLACGGRSTVEATLSMAFFAGAPCLADAGHARVGPVKGYFGIGVEGVSKPMNLGSLLRTAHAFGASFAFTIAAAFQPRAVGHADTSDAAANLPLHLYPDVASLALPAGCRLVGIE